MLGCNESIFHGIMLGCNESNIIPAASLQTNYIFHMEAMVEIHKYSVKQCKLLSSRPTGHTIWPEKESYGCHTFVLFVS